MTQELQMLTDWFKTEKRSFPWRENISPYRVWVSEMMLQQTQASVVIAYFERWMEYFPTIQHLAQASEDQVIKVWEGLGYYSRARYLHAGAKWVVTHHGGELPASEAELQKIKGLGPYTIGAILSFAFHQKVAAVDGNVARVISRLKWVEEDIGKADVQAKLRKMTQELLPDQEPWVTMEALIELGARICTRKPKCWLCPLKKKCLAFKANKPEQLPFKGSKTKYEKISRAVVVIECENHFLVQLHPSGKLMAGLCEFPYFGWDPREDNLDSIKWQIEHSLHLLASFQKELSEVKHTFTKYRCYLYPFFWKAQRMNVIEGYKWIPIDEIKNFAFSSGHRRILAQLGEIYAHTAH